LETPFPETVTVADLELVPVLADVALQVMVPLFEPEVDETESHPALSLTFQVVFELMSKDPVDPEPDPIVRLVGDTSM
jgi:hypothetical protein